MGRPPSNGSPSFRFSSVEVAQMEALLQKHEGQVPPRDLLVALANSFSNSAERAGKMVVQMKQVWSWFQNRRYALRAKMIKSPEKSGPSPVTQDNVTPLRSAPPVPQQLPVTSDPHMVRNASENPQMEFEARSTRDGAWYDVQAFLSRRYLETSNPEVLVRFTGFGSEEDEWVNIRKHVRQRSLPCEASECIVVIPGDLILCFQEGKEQALYFDAHVLDAQRRRHDVRGCRCRYLVRFDHDQSEEIVPLRKICRRPETDYRLQQLHAEVASASVSAEPPKPVVDLTTSRMANLGPSYVAIANHPPSSIGAGPSPLAPAATLAPTQPPVVASSPTSVQAPVPTPATDPSTATVPVSAPVPSAPAPVTAPVAPAPVAAVTEPVAPAEVTASVAPAEIAASVAPAEVGKPIALASVVAPVAPASVIAAIAATLAASLVKIEIDNSVPTPKPMEVDNVNGGMAADEIAPQETVTNPAATSIVPVAKLTEGSGPETDPLTGTEHLSGNPTMMFPEPDNVESSIPVRNPLADGTLGAEDRTRTVSSTGRRNNVSVKTEDVKDHLPPSSENIT